MLKSNPIVSEFKSVQDFLEEIKSLLVQKGYVPDEVYLACYDRDSYGQVALNIRYKLQGSNETECEWFHQNDGNVRSLYENVSSFLSDLELSDVAYKKGLIRRLENVTSDLDAAGYDEAKDIVEKILLPLRTNLLESKIHE